MTSPHFGQIAKRQSGVTGTSSAHRGQRTAASWSVIDVAGGPSLESPEGING